MPIGAVGAHRGAANAVLFHSTDTYAASVGEDGLLKFWQLPLAAERKLPPHGDAVTALMLSADGNQIFSASADKTIRASAFATGQTTKSFAGPAAAVTALAASGTLVAGGTADHRLFLWNAADGKVISQGIAHQGAVTGIAFHPQGTQLLTSSADGLLKLWAMPPVPGRVLPHPDGVTAAAPSADGKRLVTGGADKIVRTWTLAGNPGTLERQYAGHTGAVHRGRPQPERKRPGFRRGRCNDPLLEPGQWTAARHARRSCRAGDDVGLPSGRPAIAVGLRGRHRQALAVAAGAAEAVCPSRSGHMCRRSVPTVPAC